MHAHNTCSWDLLGVFVRSVFVLWSPVLVMKKDFQSVQVLFMHVQLLACFVNCRGPALASPFIHILDATDATSTDAHVLHHELARNSIPTLPSVQRF